MFQNTKQVILKVTRGCNLRCTYCYVFDKDDYNEESMTVEVFESTVRRWFSECDLGNIDIPTNYRPGDKVLDAPTWMPLELVFHGGEALKIGKEKFMTFCKIATQLAREYGKMLNLTLQTNGTLIDDDWIDIFRKYNIQPGISFDGFGESDKNRKANGKLVENIIKLRGYGINCGLLTILHKQNYKNVLQDLQMIQSIGINSIKMNRGVDVAKDDGTFELTAEELLETNEKVLNFMLENPTFRETTLWDKMKKYVENISYGQESSVGDICYTRWCGAGNGIIEVEPDGETLFCGRNSERSASVMSGAVASKDVAELIHGHKMWGFHMQKVDSVIERKCNLCPAQSFCDYGCPSFSYQKYGKGIIDDLTCDYNKGLIKLFSKNVVKISKLVEKDISNESYRNYLM